MSMKKILVTGGAGFLGSNIANAIADEEEYRVVVCDIFHNSEKWRNLSKHFIFQVISPYELFPFMDANKDKLEAVVHMGAVSSTTATDVDHILEHNFSLPKTIWGWCAIHNVRMIYASSAATYGDGSSGFDDDISKEYLNKLRPMNAYGWSKALFDQFVSTLVEKNEKIPPQWAGLKIFNAYGPNEYHKDEQRSVANKIYPHAAHGRPVHLFHSYNPEYGDGEQKRDFIYVKDVVKVVKWLLDNPDVSGLFNLGTGEARSFNDLAKALFNAVGKKPDITYFDMPEEIKSKYQYFTQANMKQLRNAGYKEPFYSLEEGIKDYVQHYLMHEDDPYF